MRPSLVIIIIIKSHITSHLLRETLSLHISSLLSLLFCTSFPSSPPFLIRLLVLNPPPHSKVQRTSQKRHQPLLYLLMTRCLCFISQDLCCGKLWSLQFMICLYHYHHKIVNTLNISFRYFGIHTRWYLIFISSVNGGVFNDGFL